MHWNGDQRDCGQVGRISDSLRRLSYMVKDLLDVSRLEGGFFCINRQPLDLVDLVHGVVDAARSDRRQIEAKTPEHFIVWGDPGRLTQGVQNLVGTALTHTPAGVPIQVAADARTVADGEWEMVEVHDEGPGIPAHVLPQFFGQHASGEKFAGMGLGLYLARGVAAAHGGTLQVHSEVGRGATFSLLLPLDDHAPD